MNHLIREPHELDVYAEELLGALSAAANEASGHATVLGLSGELGAGKTTFVQSLARALHVAHHVTSPTFVIARYYEIPGHARFERLVHIDAYRIEDKSELRPIGFASMLADPTNLVVIEWPELLGKSFPDYAKHLVFEVVDETSRRIHDKKEA